MRKEFQHFVFIVELLDVICYMAIQREQKALGEDSLNINEIYLIFIILFFYLRRCLRHFNTAGADGCEYISTLMCIFHILLRVLGI
jgi:hypothetical protein